MADRTYTVNAGESLGPVQLGFFARSMRVDNPTGQWYFYPGTAEYILPQSVGRTIVIPGTQSAHLVAQTPEGQTSTPQAGQKATVTFLDESPAVLSGGYIGARLEPYDRNPITDIDSYVNAALGNGTAQTTRWSYTVPAGKIALASPAQIRVTCVAASGDGTNNATFRITLDGVEILRVFIYANTAANILGDTIVASFPNTLYLPAGSVITATTETVGANTRTYNVFIGQERLEFDA